MIAKPMLAGKVEDASALRFPVIASPKIDGIRCLKLGGKVLTRALKPIPNQAIRQVLEAVLPDGIDGEVLSGTTFQACTSAVMSHEGTPEFTFHAFDYVARGLDRQYQDRIADLQEWWNRCYDEVHAMDPRARVRVVHTEFIPDLEHLQAFEEACLEDGYEGVMVRDPRGPYKNGRSTWREGWLLKLKRFEDSEAEVIGFVEQMMNTNEQTTNELGLAKRSSAKAGKVGKGTLGTMVVRDVRSGVEFEVGTGVGLTQELRQRIWDARDSYLGRVVKYRHQPHGTKDKPRLPIWLGFRDARDL